MKQAVILRWAAVRRRIPGILFMLAVSYIIAIGVLLSSDAYRTSREYVLNSDEIQAELGPLVAVGFTPRAGMRFQWNSYGAYYVLNVLSVDRRRSKVFVDLRYVNGQWQVVDYKIIQ
jgi:hypothetical protein